MQRITIEAAMEAITIEAATQDSARGLCAALSPFRTDLIESEDGGQHVRVELGRGNRETARVLDAIDDYFSRGSKTPTVRITFGGRSYALRRSRRRQLVRYTDLRKPRATRARAIPSSSG
jgi:hypothetical protein